MKVGELEKRKCANIPGGYRSYMSVIKIAPLVWEVYGEGNKEKQLFPCYFFFRLSAVGVKLLLSP